MIEAFHNLGINIQYRALRRGTRRPFVSYSVVSLISNCCEQHMDDRGLGNAFGWFIVRRIVQEAGS